MATVDKYKIKIEVDGADKVIDVNEKVEELGQTINNAAKIGLAAFAALAGSAAKMADELVDLAGTAGMTVGKIYQMSIAAEAAGGSFDQVGQMLLKFSNSVQGAVEGNDKLRDSFEQVGISREQLATLNDEQLFQAVVTGLGNMADGAEKTALTMDLLGKKAATTNMKDFSNSLNEAVDPNIEKLFTDAADAIGKMEKAFRSLQVAALQTIQPILQAIGKFELSVEDAQKTIQVLGAVIATVFAAGTVRSIVMVVGAIRTLTTVTKGAVVAQTALLALMGPAGWATIAAAVAAGTAAYFALGNAIDSATDSQNDFTESLDIEQQRIYNDLLAKREEIENRISSSRGRGNTSRRNQLREELAAINAEIAAWSTPFVGPMPSTGTTSGSSDRQLQQTAAERLLATTARTTEQMAFQNEQANSLRQTIIDVANIEQSRARMISDNARSLVDMNNELFDIETKIQEERAKGSESNQSVIRELERQGQLIRDQHEETIRLNRAEYDSIQSHQAKNREIQEELDLLYSVSIISAGQIKAQELLLQATGKTADEAQRIIGIQQETMQSVIEIGRLEQELNMAKLTGNQNSIDAINQLIRIEKIRHMSVLQGIEAEKRAREALDNSAVAGATSAMEQISKQFTPYQMAQDAILTSWNHIGNAIEDVARGGSASFKDMARSIITDIGVMISKALVFRAITGVMGSMGLDLPGLAKGGPAEAGQPYIVGEKGPELFVPKGAGTVIPNNKLTAPSSSGPAAAQPQQTVVNNVYNISAIDSRGVAEFFYSNRKMMLGTVSAAQKELPYGMA